MATVTVTDQNFDEIVSSRPIVLLDFWADWCAPCHAFSPIYEAASEKHADILFGKINTELEEKLAKEFEIFSIPTLIAAKDETIVFARPGFLGADKLEKLIQDLRDGRLSVP